MKSNDARFPLKPQDWFFDVAEEEETPAPIFNRRIGFLSRIARRSSSSFLLRPQDWFLTIRPPAPHASRGTGFSTSPDWAVPARTAGMVFLYFTPCA
jgi:hypothetical protein